MKSVGMPECNKFSLCNFDQAILLVGHGSSSQPMSGEILLEYGQYMSSRGYFRKIEVGAILCTPPLINALQTLKGSVRVLPVMMSNRHIVRDSTNELVEREDEFPSPFQLSFLDPVGEAEEISSIAYSVAQDAAADREWGISEITINLVEHGSTRRPASRMMTEHHARNLELTRKCQNVLVSYLEEPPFFQTL
jgi:sirohydrochlorin ferrochelatase